MNTSLKNKLQNKDLLIGSIVTLPSPEIAEILLNSGFDWLFIDLEHTSMSIKDAMRIIQSVESDIPCIVRVPSLDEIWIKKVLDIGASGIIVPQIQTAEEAERAIELCKYPPEGIRSVGIARAHGYGKNFNDYISSANENISIILQIEHKRGVENINDIVKVEGIDALFLGPYDLSASMGKTGLVDHKDVLNAIGKVTASAQNAALPLGIFGSGPNAVRSYINDGYTLIAVGIDTMMLQSAADNIRSQL